MQLLLIIEPGSPRGTCILRANMPPQTDPCRAQGPVPLGCLWANRASRVVEKHAGVGLARPPSKAGDAKRSL